MPLVKQCEETIERFKLNKKLFDSGKNVELSYPCSWSHCCAVFPFGLPISAQRLQQLHSIGKYSDINICIEGHGFVAQPHKIVLSLWSVPFAKVSPCYVASSLCISLVFLWSKITQLCINGSAFRLCIFFFPFYQFTRNNFKGVDYFGRCSQME